jgi:DNA polymerase-3 subunit gamma/tau
VSWTRAGGGWLLDPRPPPVRAETMVSYEPLALKYRPRVFADVVGHEAVAQTLRQAVASGRVANAFLFAGSRGVGKTSVARILAKALQCPRAEGGEPCGACEICLSIARGDDIDVIEIDGASNRGIDEIRAVRDGAAYAPARSHYKVYIIDEVHMLTTPAFNALLKTLEEPPPHVRFIFATTEPQAVPETILSRCQRFEFRRIPAAAVIRRLRDICTREGVDVADEVLAELADKAEGGLRDALGLLDQAISYAGLQVTREAVAAVLGRIDAEVLASILGPLGRGEAGPLLDALDAAFDAGREAEDLLDQLAEVLRVALLREARDLPGGGEGRIAPLVAELRGHFDLDRLLLALRLLLNTRREIRAIGQGRVQVELCLLKILRSRDLLWLAEGRGSSGGGGASAPRMESGGMAPPVPPAETPSAAPATATMPALEPVAASLDAVRAEWPRFLATLRRERARLAALLDRGEPASVSGTELAVELPSGASYAAAQLSGAQKRSLEEALAQHFRRSWRVLVRCAAGQGPAESVRPAQRVLADPNVRRLIESFGGGVVAVEGSGGAAETAPPESAGEA